MIKIGFLISCDNIYALSLIVSVALAYIGYRLAITYKK